MERYSNAYRLCGTEEQCEWIGYRLREDISGVFRVSEENEDGRKKKDEEEL